MCNLSEVILGEGIEEGFQKGKQQGLQQGLEQGKEAGLRSLVKTVKSFVGDDIEKVSKAVRNNEDYADVSDAEIRKYWNK